MIRNRNLRRLVMVAAVTAAPALSLAVAGVSSSPAPTAHPKDLACVWVGQVNTGVCVVAPTNTVG